MKESLLPSVGDLVIYNNGIYKIQAVYANGSITVKSKTNEWNILLGSGSYETIFAS